MPKVKEYSVVYTVSRCLGSRCFINYKVRNYYLATNIKVVGIQAAEGQDADTEAVVRCLASIEEV
jgi:hypothetical protein